MFFVNKPLCNEAVYLFIRRAYYYSQIIYFSVKYKLVTILNIRSVVIFIKILF